VQGRVGKTATKETHHSGTGSNAAGSSASGASTRLGESKVGRRGGENFKPGCSIPEGCWGEGQFWQENMVIHTNKPPIKLYGENGALRKWKGIKAELHGEGELGFWVYPSNRHARARHTNKRCAKGNVYVPSVAIPTRTNHRGHQQTKRGPLSASRSPWGNHQRPPDTY